MGGSHLPPPWETREKFIMLTNLSGYNQRVIRRKFAEGSSIVPQAVPPGLPKRPPGSHARWGRKHVFFFFDFGQKKLRLVAFFFPSIFSIFTVDFFDNENFLGFALDFSPRPKLRQCMHTGRHRRPPQPKPKPQPSRQGRTSRGCLCPSPSSSRKRCWSSCSRTRCAAWTSSCRPARPPPRWTGPDPPSPSSRLPAVFAPAVGVHIAFASQTGHKPG